MSTTTTATAPSKSSTTERTSCSSPFTAIRAALKGLAPDIEDRLLAAGIEPTARAETVDIERFAALARTFA